MTLSTNQETNSVSVVYIQEELIKIKDTLTHAEEGIRALFRHIERIDRLSRATERRLKDIERKQ